MTVIKIKLTCLNIVFSLFLSNVHDLQQAFLLAIVAVQGVLVPRLTKNFAENLFFKCHIDLTGK